MSAGSRRSTSYSVWLYGLIDSFETAWLSGRRPDIDDYLPKESTDRLEALVELVHIDLERRIKAGEAARVENYLARYPELTGNSSAVADLVKAEFVERRRLEPALGLDEYIQRFPRYREQLGALIAEDSTQPPGPAGLDTGTPVSSCVDDEMPARLGRHRVERLLGKGGFGRVYLAYDEQLKRSVAIKVPHRRLVSNPELAGTYLAEARILACLDHPHIVPVHDVGQTEDGLPFVVSKFIEGTDLAKQLKESRFTFSESAQMVATVADALQHAHQKGLVHRDIKPANILLDTANGVYLADFGLALREEDFGKGQGITGTPAYMSPEQASGEGHVVDGRSDIFSLGAVFYQLLTGRPPFVGNDNLDVLTHIATLDVRPPRQLNPTIPKELERICLKALAKRPTERYTTALDLSEDLRKWIAGEEVEGEGWRVKGERAARGEGRATGKERGEARGLRLAVSVGRLRLAVSIAFGVVVLMAVTLPSLLMRSPPGYDVATAPPVFSKVGKEAEQRVDLDPIAPEPLQVGALEVLQFPSIDGKSTLAARALGTESFGAALDDDIKVRARLSRAAYSYLIVFRPDGKDELLYPQSANEIPKRTENPEYPSSDQSRSYGLTEGTGLWLVALVASDKPLPAYSEWRKQHAGGPWVKSEGTPNVVWWYDGQWLEPLTRGGKDTSRGDRLNPQTGPIVRVVDWLKAETGATVSAVGFTVEPKR